jgi:hypothetical protein
MMHGLTNLKFMICVLHSALYYVFCLSFCRPLQFFTVNNSCLVAVRSKASVYGRSFSGIAGSNPAGGDEELSVLIVVCCQIEVSASGLSLVQRGPTECSVSECDRKASKIRRPCPTGGSRTLTKNSFFLIRTTLNCSTISRGEN